jgi:predicted transcriptional regulator
MARYMAPGYTDNMMHKTTIYLPGELKAALERAASETRRTESDIIREGLEFILARYEPRFRERAFSTAGTRRSPRGLMSCWSALASRDFRHGDNVWSDFTKPHGGRTLRGQRAPRYMIYAVRPECGRGRPPVSAHQLWHPVCPGRRADPATRISADRETMDGRNLSGTAPEAVPYRTLNGSLQTL